MDLVLDTSGVKCNEYGEVIDDEVGYGDNSDDEVEDVNMNLASLPPASEEQEVIISMMQTSHVLVDSVAGCGKTTTIIHAAMRYPEKKFLILMYNKRLKEESRRRFAGLGLGNVEVQNFHSFFVRYYVGESFTDVGLAKTISRHEQPKMPYSFDYIIIDEAQDMKLIFFRAVSKIAKDNLCRAANLLILGDKFQNVYKFLGSDERFLIYAPRIYSKILGVADLEWKMAKLSVSYRLTKQTAAFINSAVLRQNRIIALAEGPLVKYAICNLYKTPVIMVEDAIVTYGYENIFIVSNSVRSGKSPLRNIANIMSQKGIPIFVPNSDDAEIDEKVIRGKLVFTTYNQTKGLERDCVFIFNIDEWNPHKGSECPNAIYVAMTRAKKQLILLHSSTANFAPFISPTKAKEYSEFKIYGKFKPKEQQTRADPSEVSVSQIVEYLSGEVINKACEYFTAKSGHDGYAHVQIPTSIATIEDLYEDVSDITGVMIPAYYEFITTGQTQIYVHMNVKARALITEPTMEDIRTETGISKLLHMANVYISHDSGYLHKLAQITKYDWVTPENLQLLDPRLNKYMGLQGEQTQNKKNLFEFKLAAKAMILGKYLMGAIDCIALRENFARVYEFKCVSTLKRTHLIQLAIYAYLLEMDCLQNPKNPTANIERRYILANLLSGKYYRITFHLADLAEMVEFLIMHKFYINNSKTDILFMEEVQQCIDEFKTGDFPR